MVLFSQLDAKVKNGWEATEDEEKQYGQLVPLAAERQVGPYRLSNNQGKSRPLENNWTASKYIKSTSWSLNLVEYLWSAKLMDRYGAHKFNAFACKIDDFGAESKPFKFFVEEIQDKNKITFE